MLQIRTQTLQAEYDHVYSADPALDRSDKGWRAKYDRALETSNLKELPLLPGAEPVIWKLRHLTTRERSLISDAGGNNQALLLCARLALVGAEGIVDEKGEPFVIERLPDRRLGGVQAVPDPQVDALYQIGDGELLAELGLRAYRSLNPQKG